VTPFDVVKTRLQAQQSAGGGRLIPERCSYIFCNGLLEPLSHPCHHSSVKFTGTFVLINFFTCIYTFFMIVYINKFFLKTIFRMLFIRFHQPKVYILYGEASHRHCYINLSIYYLFIFYLYMDINILTKILFFLYVFYYY
jgi:hypothetical protein